MKLYSILYIDRYDTGAEWPTVDGRAFKTESEASAHLINENYKHHHGYTYPYYKRKARKETMAKIIELGLGDENDA